MTPYQEIGHTLRDREASEADAISKWERAREAFAGLRTHFGEDFHVLSFMNSSRLFGAVTLGGYQERIEASIAEDAQSSSSEDTRLTGLRDIVRTVRDLTGSGLVRIPRIIASPQRVAEHTLDTFSHVDQHMSWLEGKPLIESAAFRGLHEFLDEHNPLPHPGKP